MLNDLSLPMLWFPYPDLCEFHLLGRPRRTKEGDLKVRTQRAVEGDALDIAGRPSNLAHISVAIPNALDAPAAWEASQSEQKRLEGKKS